MPFFYPSIFFLIIFFLSIYSHESNAQKEASDDTETMRNLYQSGNYPRLTNDPNENGPMIVIDDSSDDDFHNGFDTEIFECKDPCPEGYYCNQIEKVCTQTPRELK